MSTEPGELHQQRTELKEERNALLRRAEEVRAEHATNTVQGPVMLLAGGGSMAIISFMGAGFFRWLASVDLEDEEDNPYTPRERRQVRKFLLCGGIGAALAIGGGVWLGLRVRRRIQLSKELRYVNQRLQEVESRLAAPRGSEARPLSLALAPWATRQGAGAALTLTF